MQNSVTPSAQAQRYLHFAAAMRAARAESPFQFLDLNGESVLEFLAQTSSEGRKLQVLQLMQYVPGMSGTTAHRQLKLLVARGLVTLEVDPGDRRTKYAQLTKAAWTMLTRRGQLMMDASNGNNVPPV